MDLNHLFYRHQISLMRADAARSCEARHQYRGLAILYAGKIRQVQLALGAAAAAA